MRFLSNVVASIIGVFVALALVAFFFFFFIFAVALSSDDTPRVAEGSVLTLELSGTIPERVSGDPFARALLGETAHDLRDLKNALEKAAADERIRGVWLQLEGVSASWATLEEVRAALQRFKAQSGKPLIASSSDFGMAEDDYFLATAADSVFAAPQSGFEFNGFYTSVTFYKGALDKLGIEPQIVRAGTYKSAVEPFLRKDLSAPNEEQLTELLRAQNEHFLQAVAQNRPLEPAALQNLSENEALLTADGALRAGLIDGLRHRDEVLDGWRARLGLDADEEVEQTTLGDYARVPASDAGLDARGSGRVAVVYAEGQIVSGEAPDFEFGTGPETLGSEDFAASMRAVREDDGIDAVVLRINSPGGSASASEAMRRQAELTAQQKPLIVSMGDVAASGGYWLATAADTLVADPLTITGSIGVFSVLFDAGPFFNDDLGVTFGAVRTNPTADLYSGVRPLSARERRLLEQSTEETYQAFLEKVSASSGLSVDSVNAVAQGRVWAGADAERVGLVDTLGTLGDAVGMAAEAAGLSAGGYRTTAFPRPEPFFERFMSGMNAQATAAWTKATTSLAERSLLRQRRLLQRLAREHGTVQARLPFRLTVK